MDKSWISSDGSVAYDVEIPFEAKPVFLALSNFNALLGDAKVVKENYSSLGSVYEFVFNSSDGREIYMMWTTKQSGENKTMTFSEKFVTRYDMYGNKTILQSDSKSYTLALTDEPIYIEVKSPYTLSFKNETDTTIDKLNDEESVEVDIQINDENLKNAQYIVAMYDNKNTMIKCELLPVKDGRGSIKLSQIDDTHIIKVFGFNNLDKLEPVISAGILKRGQ